MKKEKLFRIILEAPDYSVKEAIEKYGHELAKNIVSKIAYAVDNNLEQIDVGEIVAEKEIICLKSSKPFFYSTLEQNLETLIKYEDYETCAICKKYLDLLQKNLDIKEIEFNFVED